MKKKIMEGLEKHIFNSFLKNGAKLIKESNNNHLEQTEHKAMIIA